ncbi:hypothetical protein DFH06DRAFT_1141537 [Mycena polygramma]|nr:hypothetical protein DFH06DRAFT_1141537 [Mycena polygramma]
MSRGVRRSAGNERRGGGGGLGQWGGETVGGGAKEEGRQSSCAVNELLKLALLHEPIAQSAGYATISKSRMRLWLSDGRTETPRVGDDIEVAEVAGRVTGTRRALAASAFICGAVQGDKYRCCDNRVEDGAEVQGDLRAHTAR